MADKLMMGTTAYRKAWSEAKGDKAAYMEAVKDFGERHRSTATILWAQFNREIEVRQCICKTGGEMVNFLKHLPLSHMEHSITTVVSAEMDIGYVNVVSDPIAKTITIVTAEGF